MTETGKHGDDSAVSSSPIGSRSTREHSIGPFSVPPLALGTANLSLDPSVSRSRSFAAIKAALDGGVRLIDTARAYTTADEPAHSEKLVRDALAGESHRGDVIIASKGGHFRQDRHTWGIDASPAALAADCDASLVALGVDAIDLYFIHWPDPLVPYAESVGALQDLRRAGKVRAIGVSNVDLPQLEIAVSTAEIDAVQNHTSVDGLLDAPVIARCQELGIAYLDYSPTREFDVAQRPVVTNIASAYGVPWQTILLAWLIQSEVSAIPIAGATRPETAAASARALHLGLTEGEIELLAREISRVDG